MNWWPFHGECKQEIDRLQMIMDSMQKVCISKDQLFDDVVKDIETKQREIDGYKCTLELKLNEINELKAIYNYQVADLEGKIKQLSEENEKQAYHINVYKEAEVAKNNKMLEMSSDSDRIDKIPPNWKEHLSATSLPFSMEQLAESLDNSAQKLMNAGIGLRDKKDRKRKK